MSSIAAMSARCALARNKTREWYVYVCSGIDRESGPSLQSGLEICSGWSFDDILQFPSSVSCEPSW